MEMRPPDTFVRFPCLIPRVWVFTRHPSSDVFRWTCRPACRSGVPGLFLPRIAFRIFYRIFYRIVRHQGRRVVTSCHGYIAKPLLSGQFGTGRHQVSPPSANS